jgi:hypothetical protein
MNKIFSVSVKVGQNSFVSGVFDSQERADESIRAFQMEGVIGVYRTVNYLLPGAFAVTNGLHLTDTRPRNEDMNPTRLYIDVDRAHTAISNASDDELVKAIETRDAIQAYLKNMLGADPERVGMSGNGGYLVYLTNAPRLNQRVIRTLAALFDGPFSHIDKSTHDAARLMPYPGTRKAKHRDQQGRPQRLTTEDFFDGVEPISEVSLIEWLYEEKAKRPSSHGLKDPDSRSKHSKQDTQNRLGNSTLSENKYTKDDEIVKSVIDGIFEIPKEGERNTTLFDLACRFNRLGHAATAANAYLLPVFDAAGLGEAEIRQTIQNAYQYDPGDPEIDAHVEAYIKHIYEIDFRKLASRGHIQSRKVAIALATLCRKARKKDFHASVRDVSKLSGLNVSTTSKFLNRLYQWELSTVTNRGQRDPEMARRWELLFGFPEAPPKRKFTRTVTEKRSVTLAKARSIKAEKRKIALETSKALDAELSISENTFPLPPQSDCSHTEIVPIPFNDFVTIYSHEATAKQRGFDSIATIEAIQTPLSVQCMAILLKWTVEKVESNLAQLEQAEIAWRGMDGNWQYRLANTETLTARLDKLAELNGNKGLYLSLELEYAKQREEYRLADGNVRACDKKRKRIYMGKYLSPGFVPFGATAREAGIAQKGAQRTQKFEAVAAHA